MGLLGAIGTAVGSFTGMPWLGAVGAGLDSFVDKGDSARSQGEANEFNAKQAQINRDFQERMRGTQYQTAVSDMQAAGLNPMLAYSQGGAGTPVGASGGGSLSSPALNKVGAGISSAAQSAQTAQSLQSLQMNQAQIEQVKAQTAQIISETVDNKINTALKANQAEKLGWDADVSERLAENEKAKWRGIVADSGSKVEQFKQDVAQNTFSADAARRKALNDLTQLEIPKSKADAQFFNDFKDAPQIIKLLYQFFGTAHSAGSIFRR